jgi:hypothetical protein
MGRPRTTESLVCPLCKRDFSKERAGTTAYKRHMERKNPCVPPEGHEYHRDRPKFFEGVVINDFEDMDLGHVTGPDAEGRKEVWVRSVLQQIFSVPENKCIVLKNVELYPDEIYVKRQGGVKVLNIHDLTILMLLVLHERLYPFLELTGWEKYKEFEDWVAMVAGVALKDRHWLGTIEPLSYYYIAVRDFLKNYLLKMKHRRHETLMLASATFTP